MVMPTFSNIGDDENCETDSITCRDCLKDVPMLSQSISICNDSRIIDTGPSFTSLERTDHFPEFFSSVDEYNQTIDVIHPTEPYHPLADFVSF